MLGDVHRALIEAEVIAHPFRDRHEGDCAWMEEREWWYRYHDATTGPGGELEVRVRADRYAYFVHLGLTDEHAEASDDYFELEAGEERTVTVRHSARALQPADVALRSR